MAITRKCAICGKVITSGYLFDGTTALCDKECATKFFDNDEGCVDILIDENKRLLWNEKFPKQEHYRANVCHYASNCFHHFDNEQKMFAWISDRIGKKVSSYKQCEDWGRDQEWGIAHTNGYIEILVIDDLKEFYRKRQEYVAELRKCDDLMHKSQRMQKSFKRDRVFHDFTCAYENANVIYGTNPEVWQGEI